MYNMITQQKRNGGYRSFTFVVSLSLDQKVPYYKRVEYLDHLNFLANF